MSFIIGLVRRLPVLSAVVAALVICAGAYAALSAVDTASPELEAAPTGTVPPVPKADDAQARQIAAEAAAESGQGVAPGSVSRLVASQEATRGYSLWAWRTEDGHPAVMVVDPKGTPVTWTGCRQEIDYADRCGGYATPDGLLVLAGRAVAQVESVSLRGPALPASPAVLGDGGWLWVGTGFGADTPASRVPDVVVSRTEDGARHEAPVAVE